MTDGHKHRTVRVPGFVLWALTRPVIWRTRNTAWADRSRLVFKPGRRQGTWVLSPLGLLHALTGLTIDAPHPTRTIHLPIHHYSVRIFGPKEHP